MKPGIEFVYFDIGGVFINTDRYFSKVAADFGLERSFMTAQFKEHSRELTEGTLSPQAFWIKAANVAGLYGNPVENYDFLASWVNDYIPQIFMHELAARIASNYRIGLLSNVYQGMVDKLLEAGLLPRLNYEVIIDSSVVGLAKPDPDIFKLAQTRNGLKGSAIAYIDDKPEMLLGSSDFKWHTIVCDPHDPAATTAMIAGILSL